MPDKPTTAKAGDKIAHHLIPGYVMTVEAVGTCETDWARPDLRKDHLTC